MKEIEVKLSELDLFEPPVVYINHKRAKRLNPRKEGVRFSFILDGVIVKVDTEYVHKEYRIWNRVKRTSYGIYFVPVLAHGKVDGRIWNAFPYLKGLRLIQPHWAYDIIQEIKHRYDLHDTGHNWGMYKGQPILYDYGFED